MASIFRTRTSASDAIRCGWAGLDTIGSMNVTKVETVLRAFEREKVEYKVFGGVALNLHGLARFTQDLDVFVKPDAENIERLRKALHSVYDDSDIDEISTEDLLGDYPAVQYIPPVAGFHLDIVTRLGEAYSWDDLDTEVIELEGVDVRVVTPRQLFEMKRDTVREVDRGDAERLWKRFDLET